MDIILKERGHGKTTDLIRLSAQTGNVIVCVNPNIIEQKAEALHIEIPKPVTPQELIQMDRKPCGVYIDELSLNLKKIFRCPVCGFTETV